MSNTHILVEKNGIQDKMNITVWKAIGEDSNKDGWKRVPETPIEVIAMKSKIAEEPQVIEVKSTKSEVVVDPVGKVEEKAIVKTPVKTTKKK